MQIQSKEGNSRWVTTDGQGKRGRKYTASKVSRKGKIGSGGQRMEKTAEEETRWEEKKISE